MTCLTFWEWVEDECAQIESDGCSKASGAFRRRCRVHDLAYFHGKDPVDAYRRYKDGDPFYWQHATPTTRAEADGDFRRGIQADSAMGFFSPFAAWRWLGLKVGGQGAWDGHRAREAASLGV